MSKRHSIDEYEQHQATAVRRGLVVTDGCDCGHPAMWQTIITIITIIMMFGWRCTTHQLKMLDELQEIERKERELQQRKRDIEGALAQLVSKEQQLAISRTCHQSLLALHACVSTLWFASNQSLTDVSSTHCIVVQQTLLVADLDSKLDTIGQESLRFEHSIKSIKGIHMVHVGICFVV
jgi:hypothetical protein